MKAVVNFAIVIKETNGIHRKCSSIFQGLYTFETFISCIVLFKCDFELILYHDV
jgi:hypothetical protein